MNPIRPRFLDRRLAVPASAFFLAIVLSISAGQGAVTAASRKPGKPTGCECHMVLKDLEGKLQADQWNPKAPGGGAIRVRGSYRTETNTVGRALREELGIMMSLKLLDPDGELRCEGVVYGRAEHASKSLDGNEDCKVENDKVSLGEKKRDGLSADDGNDLDEAIRRGLLEIVSTSECRINSTIENKGDLLNKLSAEIEVRVTVTLQGNLKDGTLCEEQKISGTASVQLDAKGDSRKPGDLNPPKKK